MMNLAQIFAKNFEPGRTPFRRLEDVGGNDGSPSPAALVHRTGDFVRVRPEALRQLAQEAFHDINFFFRTRQLEQWAEALDDPEASAAERYVLAALLKNAAISAEGILPACQDTGTATVMAFKGERVLTGCDDMAHIEAGVAAAYSSGNLRHSQMAPLSMFEEQNTGTNLPSQIDIHATQGDEYRLLFVAKGGGSSNKTSLFQQNRALLNERSLMEFLREKVRSLDVAACPPYHLALVIGGTSPEINLQLLKLATTGAIDLLPTVADGSGAPYRDREWEDRLKEIAAQSGLGGQFGGKYLALDTRVVRCGRHGGSCPVSLGVSCSAHRNALAMINADGVFLEQFDRNPARFLPKATAALSSSAGLGAAPRIRLDEPAAAACRQLAAYPVGTLLLLSGTLVLARDAAHARFGYILQSGGTLPDYLFRYPVYYAGPAETPPGCVIGSLGPTTAQRMDEYLPDLLARGASLVTLAKGNRSPAAAAACRKYGGCYLGTIGGAAALLAREHVLRSEVIDYADLGMESVRRIEVADLPVFIVLR
jgi:fumarate hydratase, class I